MYSRADLALILILVVAAIISPAVLPRLLPTPAAGAIEIKTPDKTLRVPLNADETFTVKGSLGPTVVEVARGKVRIVRSTCPDNARHRFEGWASRPGNSLVCLPNKVVVTVGGGELDATVR